MFTCIFFSCFCFSCAGSIFVSLFVPLNQPCPVDLIFYRTFEWHGGMWRKCQNVQRQCILGIWVFVSLAWSPAPEIWILGTWVSAPKVRRGSWDDLSSIIHPRWLCLGKPPVLWLVTLLFSNTLTTLRRLPGRDCVKGGLQNTEKAMSQDHQPWMDTCMDLKSGMCPEGGCVPTPPTRDVTLLSSAMSQDWKSASLLSRYKEVSEGLLFPIAQVHAFHLPTRGPEKTPKFHTMKAGGYLFIIF